MSHVLDALATAFTAAALLAGVVTFAATRQLRLSTGVFLDLLLAAGLLRLATPSDPGVLAVVAAVVAVRRVIGLRWAAPAWRAGRPQVGESGDQPH